MLLLEDDFEVSHSGCTDVLSRDSSAFACLVAAAALLDEPYGEEGSPLVDDEGQIVDYEVLQALIGPRVRELDTDNLHRIMGLGMAASGDEFFTDPDHFTRLVGAIVWGDPYRFEEDGDTPTLVEMTWAIFQVDLLLEESADELLGPHVSERIRTYAEENPADEEVLAEIEPDFAGGAEAFYEELLKIRRAILSSDLVKCGARPKFLEDLGLPAHS